MYLYICVCVYTHVCSVKYTLQPGRPAQGNASKARQNNTMTGSDSHSNGAALGGGRLKAKRKTTARISVKGR